MRTTARAACRAVGPIAPTYPLVKTHIRRIQTLDGVTFAPAPHPFIELFRLAHSSPRTHRRHVGFAALTGEVFWGPMAYAMMGGLLIATVLTLFFLPALYAMWYRVRISESHA